MIRYLGIVIILISILTNYACEDIKTYPAVPEISYKSCDLIDTIGLAASNKTKLLKITINFTDGDGDLFNPDTSVHYTDRSKVFLNFYKRINGQLVIIPGDTTLAYAFNFPYNPVMDRIGQDKTQEGTIEVSYMFFAPFDTINVDIFISDLAGHKSNIVRVPKDIIWLENKK